MFVRLENVSVGYDGAPVLENIDLDIEEGDYLGLVGPNGCGKSTLLKAILGSLPPMKGTIERSPGLDIVGYVPQRHGLNPFFPLSALDIVRMGRFGRVPLMRRLSAEDEAACSDALEQVGLAIQASTLYRDLSGGQQQRVLIARALASSSNLLVLDEPTTGMDIPSETEVMQLLDRLHQERTVTVVLVTHQLNLVAEHARTLALVRDGRLLVGAMQDLLTTRSLSDAYDTPIDVIRTDGTLIVRAGKREEGSAPC